MKSEVLGLIKVECTYHDYDHVFDNEITHYFVYIRIHLESWAISSNKPAIWNKE